MPIGLRRGRWARCALPILRGSSRSPSTPVPLRTPNPVCSIGDDALVENGQQPALAYRCFNRCDSSTCKRPARVRETGVRFVAAALWVEVPAAVKGAKYSHSLPRLAWYCLSRKPCFARSGVSLRPCASCIRKGRLAAPAEKRAEPGRGDAHSGRMAPMAARARRPERVSWWSCA